MDLKKYLQLKNIYIKDFAQSIQIKPQTITNYLIGVRKPSLEIACKIEIATEGKVTIHDLIATWEKYQSKK